jgi:hypothetical protein
VKLLPTLGTDAIGGIVAFGLTFGAVILIVAPKFFTHVPSRAEQQAELETRRKQAIELDQNADAARKNLDLLRQQTAAAVHLQPATYINKRMGDMAALAEPCAVSIAQLSPGVPAPAPTSADSATPGALVEPKATIVPIKLSGTGAYPDISRFLHALHDTFRDTAISSLHITGQPDPGRSEKQAASFTVDFAWYAAPAAFADAPPNP